MRAGDKELYIQHDIDTAAGVSEHRAAAEERV